MSAQYVTAQNGAVRLALIRLQRVWSTLDHSDVEATRRVMHEAWIETLRTYGDVTATLAADRFEELTGYPPAMVRPVDPERANARLGWALDPLATGAAQQAWGRVRQLTDELVKQPGRSTMIRSSAENNIRFARVPTGAETCAFCYMLASRGAVYASRKSATETKGGMSSYHGDCDCRVEPVRGDDDLERLRADGYDPDGLYQAYLVARDAASPNDHFATKEILSELRNVLDTN